MVVGRDQARLVGAGKRDVDEGRGLLSPESDLSSAPGTGFPLTVGRRAIGASLAVRIAQGVEGQGEPGYDRRSARTLALSAVAVSGIDHRALDGIAQRAAQTAAACLDVTCDRTAQGAGAESGLHLDVFDAIGTIEPVEQHPVAGITHIHRDGIR